MPTASVLCGSQLMSSEYYPQDSPEEAEAVMKKDHTGQDGLFMLISCLHLTCAPLFPLLRPKLHVTTLKVN